MISRFVEAFTTDAFLFHNCILTLNAKVHPNTTYKSLGKHLGSSSPAYCQFNDLH